ncbi:MAG TPA: DUF2945 domain-containing protein [Telluria sp.]
MSRGKKLNRTLAAANPCSNRRLDKVEEPDMADQFKAGDKVEWNSPQGPVQGKVKKKLTSPTQIKGHDVAASQEHPEYLVVSDKTGAEAAHKAGALKKI